MAVVAIPLMARIYINSCYYDRETQPGLSSVFFDTGLLVCGRGCSKLSQLKMVW
jgi:hypothetical protein